MDKSLKSIAINYGLYLALIISSFTIIGYAVYLDLFTQWWYGITQMLLVIVFGIISSINAKKLLGGFISFKEAFSAFFITIAIGTLIPALIGFVIFNIVDPEAAVILQEKIINSQIAMMSNFGAPQEAVDQAMEQMQAEDSFFSLANTIKTNAYQLVAYSVIGLIVALATKRKDPNEA
ncbi:DUF4199 domain-containing protein [Winogradskyella undariae]|uniref:DUF4199 domain-containing protein n=1 Tax=Winogradskyella TaxID=286104 RepID=UPI00156BBE76|nr:MULTISPECIES: DUF4199 domain-containing protein [Winogradskyella]NRR90532.1 DUF4199 domain-containing protein [Winogradskyella undariae]QXP79627.1 DUF4199 domain-containing protein [Winogradskyella sp. HaHa_3_26]